MKSILLIKRSSPQIYMANQLFKRNIISQVYLEEGESIDSSNFFDKKHLNYKNVLHNLRLIISYLYKPKYLYYYIYKLINKSNFFGMKEKYDLLILKNDYIEFNSYLDIKFVKSINNLNVIEKIIKCKPNCIFIFGTSIISHELISKINCPVVNLHWGISPQYRGEGIISSLAIEGKNGPGVTIHKISNVIDDGEILYQEKPNIDEKDNFYSIGLKLTKLGLIYFSRVAFDIQKNKPLVGINKTSKKSFFFNSEYMKKNPEIYYTAWKELKQ